MSRRSRSAAHRTLPFGTVLTVQKGGRSVQVTVTDRGPFTGAFLDLSPAAASALGCRCAHRNVTATVVQMGSGGFVSRVEAVNAPSLRQSCRGSSSRRGKSCVRSLWPWPLSRTTALATVVATRTDPPAPQPFEPWKGGALCSVPVNASDRTPRRRNWAC